MFLYMWNVYYKSVGTRQEDQGFCWTFSTQQKGFIYRPEFCVLARQHSCINCSFMKAVKGKASSLYVLFA